MAAIPPPAPRQVHAQVAGLDHRLLGRGRARGRDASQERSHAAPKLADLEGLGDVVIRAKLEAEDLVELFVAGREHDDRHGALRA